MYSNNIHNSNTKKKKHKCAQTHAAPHAHGGCTFQLLHACTQFYSNNARRRQKN